MATKQINLYNGDTQLIIKKAKEARASTSHVAYILATAWHETAHTMKPVREYGGDKYLRTKKYWPYVGMGYVQLTWKYNYVMASDKLGVDFVADPKKLLIPEYAATILVRGMLEGWFTSKPLSRYITDEATDYVGARRVINGTDKANMIADYARVYERLLVASGYTPGVVPVAKPTAPTYNTRKPTLWELIKGWFSR